MAAPEPAPGSQPDEGLVETRTMPVVEAAAGATPRRRNGGPAPVVALGVLVLLLVGLYLTGYLLAGDRLPRNAVVGGVPVGGLPRSDALARLSDELGPRAAAPIQLTVNGRPTKVAPADAGLEVDYQKSIEAVGGERSLDPRTILRVLVGGGNAEPVVNVDRAKLAACVNRLARTWNTEPADASLSYAGAKIRRKPATTGLTIDPARAAATIESAYLRDTGPVALPAEVVEPAITTAEVDQVIRSFARRAVSAPVVLDAGKAGRSRITPAMIGESVTFVARDGSLSPRLNAAALRRNAAPALARIELKQPQDATVRLIDGRPRVIRAVDGTTITAADLARAVEPALTRTGKQRVAPVPLSVAKPKFSTAQARALGVREVTGAFTTYYPYLYYRNVNIGRAAELINQTLLKPGDIFSLNRVVGERTRANGFVDGFIIQGGKFRRELGGGVSQSATTTYNAMFFAGLKDIEHRPHTLYIDRYPAGREATVAWPTLDLKFQNDTRYGVLVQAFIVPGAPGRSGSITVRMWSTKTYDMVTATEPVRSNFTTGRTLQDSSPACEPMFPVPGFDVRYSRLFHRDGRVVKRENFFWRYAPTDRVICT